MSDLPGPLKELFVTVPEPKRDPNRPILSRLPTVERISEKHKWIVGAMASGFKAAEVAKMFDITPEYAIQINNWDAPELEKVRQETYDRMAGRIEDLTERIAFHAEEALSTTVKIMRSSDDTNRRLAAKDLMDRAGYAPVKKVAEVSVQVPSQEFVEAVKAMSEADEVRSMRDEWKWQAPVTVVEAPNDSTKG